MINFKNVFEHEINEKKAITHYKHCGFFDNRSLNKNIKQLKSKLELKDKLFVVEQKANEKFYNSQTRNMFNSKSMSSFNDTKKVLGSTFNSSINSFKSMIKTKNSLKVMTKTKNCKIGKSKNKETSINSFDINSAEAKDNTNNIDNIEIQQKSAYEEQFRKLYHPESIITPSYKETAKNLKLNIKSKYNIDKELINHKQVSKSDQNLASCRSVGIQDSRNFSTLYPRDSTANSNYYNNSAVQNMILTGPLISPSKVDFIYKQIFDRKFKYEFVLDQKLKHNKVKKVVIDESQRDGYISDKISKIKNKVYFMKGIFDYSFPIIVTNRLKRMNKEYWLEKERNAVKRETTMENENKKRSSNHSMTINNFMNNTFKEKQKFIPNSLSAHSPPKINFYASNQNFSNKNIKDKKPVKVKVINAILVQQFEEEDNFTS